MNDKRYLFFDCETQGLINFKEPISATPRIVQIAALITDSECVEYGSLNHIIKPENWTIPDEAAKVHGITTAIALEKGVAIGEVMGVFKQMVTLCDVIVAHNIAYDIRIVQGEMHRLSAELPQRELVCTMLAMTKVCNIPHAKWKNRVKWPKLQEAYKHCFGKEFDKAHDALADVRACRDVYFHSIHRPNVVRPYTATIPLLQPAVYDYLQQPHTIEPPKSLLNTVVNTIVNHPLPSCDHDECGKVKCREAALPNTALHPEISQQTLENLSKITDIPPIDTFLPPSDMDPVLGSPNMPLL